MKRSEQVAGAVEGPVRVRISLHGNGSLRESIRIASYFPRMQCLFESLDRLYWECTSNRPAKGIVSPNKISEGDLMHRFPTRVRQLEKTYDLQSLNADQLLEILGDEFQQRAATSQAQLELNMK